MRMTVMVLLPVIVVTDAVLEVEAPGADDASGQEAAAAAAINDDLHHVDHLMMMAVVDLLVPPRGSQPPPPTVGLAVVDAEAPALHSCGTARGRWYVPIIVQNRLI